jgi:hypothetical protein
MNVHLFWFLIAMASVFSFLAGVVTAAILIETAIRDEGE